MSFQDIVQQEKSNLRNKLELSMTECGHSIIKKLLLNEDLENTLMQFASENTISGKIYVLDANKVQITSDIYKDGVNDNFTVKELDKKLLQTIDDTYSDFYISNTYISHTSLRPSVTAVNVLRDDVDEIIGFLLLDIILSSSSNQIQSTQKKYLQLKGDPAIRDHLFNGTRQLSAMDTKIDDVHSIAKEMLCELGAFHLKLHYSSSRATIWYYDNPFEYQVHTIDEILTPDVCLLYPDASYPKQAKIPKSEIGQILSKFKKLRYMDNNIYLRAGSINTINGMIGLNFSCDGSHYMPASEFMDIVENQFDV